MTQALAAIAICSWKPHGVAGEVCSEPATHNFRWDWQEEGVCCTKCIPLMQQTAGNLGRGVTFSPISVLSSEAPVTRSERTLLIAAKLSAEAELEEVMLRGKQLYDANVDLTAQVQTHVMRAREHSARVTEKDQQIERLATDLERRERELAETSAELQRLRLLAQFAPTEQTERSRPFPSSEG